MLQLTLGFGMLHVSGDLNYIFKLILYMCNFFTECNANSIKKICSMNG